MCRATRGDERTSTVPQRVMNVNTHLVLLADLDSAMVWILAGLALAGLVFGLLSLRHRRTGRRVTSRFDQFKEHVIQFREQVEAVKERHKLLPVSGKDFQEPMAGETLTLYNQIQNDVSRLWNDWLRRMDLWDRVQVLIQAERFPGVGRLKEADRLLDQLGSFEAVDRACQDCVHYLDQLEQAHQQAQTLLGQAVDRPGQLRPQLETVARLPLPRTPYETELAACAALTEKARPLLQADPIGAHNILNQCLHRLSDLDQRLQEIVRLFHQAQEARNPLDQVAHMAAERRAQGLLLTEPEGNPDPLLEQSRTQHRLLLQALERGEAKAAAGHLEQTLALAEQVKSVIERQVAAREQCVRDIAACRAEVQRLQQATTTAQAQRSELERSFAPESWHNVADNVARTQELENASDRLLEEAVSASAEKVQHYLRACNLLEQVRQKQEQAHSPLLEIGRCLQQLTELRQECILRRQELLDLTRRVQDYFALHALVIGSSARSRFDAAEEHWRPVLGQMDALRPHWPAVQQQMAAAQREFTATLQAAEEDVRYHQQLTARLSDMSREAERVGQFLQTSREHRRQADDQYRSAIEGLEWVRRESAGKPADWKRLLQQVENAASGLKRAEELAHQDQQLAARARAEINAAERELAQAQGFFQLGISADLQNAGSLLEQARLQLAQQAYEQAIDQAGGVQRAAHQAHAEAVRRAQQEQQRLDQQRQLFEAATAAQYLSTPSPSDDASAAREPSTPEPAMDLSAPEPDQPDMAPPALEPVQPEPPAMESPNASGTDFV
jgi:hypothetical protein